MPASQFYLMAREARFRHFQRLIDSCDVMPCATGEPNYIKQIRGVYARGAMGLVLDEDQSQKVPPHIATPNPPPDPKLAHASMINLFAAKKGLFARA